MQSDRRPFEANVVSMWATSSRQQAHFVILSCRIPDQRGGRTTARCFSNDLHGCHQALAKNTTRLQIARVLAPKQLDLLARSRWLDARIEAQLQLRARDIGDQTCAMRCRKCAASTQQSDSGSQKCDVQ